MPRTFAPRVSRQSSVRKPSAFAAVILLAFVAAFGFTPFTTQVVSSQEAAAGRALSLDERVKYQRAVEEVYWRHTDWPQQNARPRPSLEEVAPVAATRAKVADVLRKSAALGRVWQRPVTAAQLQAEVERMARETRRPELLRELWQALGNDPFLVAEVIARPALVERVAASYYSADERFHGPLRAKAEEQLREHKTLDALRRAGASYGETVSVKVARKRARVVGIDATAVDASPQVPTTELSAEEWEAEEERLRSVFNTQACETCDASQSSLPVGVTSRLQEDAAGFYVTSVVAATDSTLKVARVDWPKEGFDAWWSNERTSYDPVAPSEDFNYELAEINPSAAEDDTWTPTKALPATGGAAVWTGTEMIVWGGRSGSRYNVATNTWTPTAAIGAPSPRGSFTSVWTGTEMIVWGGCGQASNFCGLNDGARYNPSTDSWTPTSTTNAPGPRRSHAAVWTGSKMIVWGGCWPGYNNSCSPASTRYLNTGGVYDPSTDTWTPTSTDAAPVGGFYRAVWTGAEMLVWNGQAGSPGGRYNLSTNTWRPINTVNRPSPRAGFSTVWTGRELIVWGGSVEGYREPLNDGGRYNPSNDTWTLITKVNAPSARASHSAVWTGAEMIVYGGDLLTDLYFPTETNTGGRYNPSTDSWTHTSKAGAPVKSGHAALWTGTEMLVWSASNNKEGARYSPSSDTWVPIDNNDSPESLEIGVWTGAEMLVWSRTPGCISGCASTGALYNPATYSWRPMSVANAPDPGSRGWESTAVWTGTEMIVWGSYDGGGRYNPRTDAWTRLSTTDAPVAPRTYHTAVWSGTEMIVWGGQKIDSQSTDVTQNTGGRYNPQTDAWTPTPTTNAPSPRYLHTATWTNGEMIVWGGVAGNGTHTNTGARYNPATDAWTPTSTSNAPEARRYHTSVWTGMELIVWGGRSGDYNSTEGLFNNGGRYNPATDAWTPTSTAGAPSPRFTHTAIWTGSLMIVWGGQSPGCYVYLCGVHTGARYNPAADAWTPVGLHRAPGARYGHLAFWTGDGMLIWGGYATEGSPQHGAIYTAPGTSPDNTPPAVRIDAPATGANFEAGADINITATATDAEGAVTAVHFYAGDTLLGSDTAAPFSFNWQKVRSGSYTLTAVAADEVGAVTRSTPVNITVEPIIGPPNAVITSPADGASFDAPATISVAADVTPNPDRAVTKVEFYLSDGRGTHTLVSTDTVAPYGFDLTNQPEGSYIIYAYAYDGDDVGISFGVRFTVKGPPDRYTISGRLTDQNGGPISGAFVNVMGPYSETVLSDADGGYSFAGLEGGAEHTIQVYKEGYDFDLAHQTFTNLSASQTANFSGAKRGSPVNIGGRIVDAGGAPAQGLRVRLDSSAPSPQYRTTDADGLFQFANMPAGDSYMVVPDDLYRSFSFGPSYRDYQPLIRHVADANFVATRVAYSISGRVTVGGVPRAGANVTLGGGLSIIATTDADGRYGFYDLSGGIAYTVTPSLSGHTFTPSSFSTTGLTNDITADFDGAAPTPTPTPATGSGTNVALAANGGTVTVSSAYDSRFTAASLNNGDRRGLNWGAAGGGWNDATGNAYPDWVEVAFSGAKTINEVDVFTVQDNFSAPSEPTESMTFSKYGVTRFDVQYWTGSAWATVPNGTVTANNGVWRKVTFAPLTTPKIRLLITGALDGYSRLVEVEAWQGAATPTPTPAPTPATGRVNVALASQGATVAASSQHSANFPASAAINGDRRGLNWGAGGGWNDGTNNAYPDWLEVTFAGAKTIDEVDVFTLQDAFSSPSEPTETTAFTKYGVTAFEAQYWTGSTWAMLPGGQVTGNNLVWRRLTFAPVTTTKVRVLVVGALNGSSRITEVEAWQADAPAPARTNHALSSNGATVTASSSYDSRFPASSINDGDRRGLNWGAGGGWNDATSDSYPDWVEVSFGGAKSVTEVNVLTVQDAFSSPSEPTEALTFTKYGVTGFDVQAWDGAQWVPVQGGSVTGNNLVWRKVTFPAVTTSKIRVVVKNALGGYSRITEVEAY